jgi:Ala-tRNA(Pro) deacylase
MAIAPTIESYLTARNVHFELTPHHRTGSTHETAEAAHVPQDHMAKAVMVRDDRGHAMVVVRGDQWLHLDALNGDTGRTFGLDEESDLAPLLPDCASGAVPPLGPAYGVETFLDEALTTLAHVNFEAGDHENLVRVSGDDFAALLQGVRRGRYTREP